MLHRDYDYDAGEGDLLSPLTETEFLQLLLRDLHDDLPNRLMRLRYLGDQARTLGPGGTIIMGGSPAYNALAEARSSFVNGNFVATIILCQALAENALAGALDLGGTSLPEKVPFAVTLRQCEEKGYISAGQVQDLQQLAALRNPLSHYRSLDDPAHIDRRSMTQKVHYLDLLRQDAFFAIAVIMRLLADKPFRVG